MLMKLALILLFVCSLNQLDCQAFGSSSDPYDQVNKALVSSKAKDDQFELNIQAARKFYENYVTKPNSDANVKQALEMFLKLEEVLKLGYTPEAYKLLKLVVEDLIKYKKNRTKARHIDNFMTKLIDEYDSRCWMKFVDEFEKLYAQFDQDSKEKLGRLKHYIFLVSWIRIGPMQDVFKQYNSVELAKLAYENFIKKAQEPEAFDLTKNEWIKLYKSINRKNDPDNIINSDESKSKSDEELKKIAEISVSKSILEQCQGLNGKLGDIFIPAERTMRTFQQADVDIFLPTGFVEVDLDFYRAWAAYYFCNHLQQKSLS